MDFLLFKLKYHIWENLTKIVKPNKREYILFFMGRYPENFKHGITAVIDSDSLVRFSLGQSVIVVRFTSTRKINEIKKIFDRVYSGYIDSYMLFRVKDTNFAKGLCQTHYNHLYDMNYFKFTTNETLERVQSFVTSMNNMRSEMQEFVNEQMVLIKEKEGLLDNNNLIEIDEEKTNIDDINPILEKIYSQGINSLTEQEKNELKKYAKND
jgi:hypothetical protein